jgi:hypothetical protein
MAVGQTTSFMMRVSFGSFMPKNFLATTPNPQGVFLQIQQWATANGFQLTGNAAGGSFGGRPGGLAGVLIGDIRGNYSVAGNQVTITVDKDLPAHEVAKRLGQFGLTLVNSR